MSLDEATLQGMKAIVETYAPVGLHMIADSPTLLALGKFQELADTTVFNRAAFARELGNWLLPNDDLLPV